MSRSGGKRIAARAGGHALTAFLALAVGVMIVVAIVAIRVLLTVIR